MVIINNIFSSLSWDSSPDTRPNKAPSTNDTAVWQLRTPKLKRYDHIMNTTPPWPSLYNLGIEILHVEHQSPTNPEGAYLYRASGTVFRVFHNFVF